MAVVLALWAQPDARATANSKTAKSVATDAEIQSERGCIETFASLLRGPLETQLSRLCFPSLGCDVGRHHVEKRSFVHRLAMKPGAAFLLSTRLGQSDLGLGLFHLAKRSKWAGRDAGWRHGVDTAQDT